MSWHDDEIRRGRAWARKMQREGVDAYPIQPVPHCAGLYTINGQGAARVFYAIEPATHQTLASFASQRAVVERAIASFLYDSEDAQ